jgi:uncharacterized protein YndB with AHSA1/START domain
MPAREHRPAQGARPSAITVSREFDAPREVVFRAWTDPEQLRRWWGPHGCSIPFCEVDLRPGGSFRLCMRMGQDIWVRGTYLEVRPPERLVFTDSFTDSEGTPVPASRYGLPADTPSETTVTVAFEIAGTRTRVIVRHEGIPVMAAGGWAESLERLAHCVASR